jgi:signal transduction histidine kinase
MLDTGQEKTRVKMEWKELADFAEYLLNNHLDDFLQTCFALLTEKRVPIITHLTPAEARNLSNKSSLELLISLTHHNPGEHVRKAIERWRTTQFPKVTRHKMVVDDVTLIAYCRKIAFLKFLPLYTKDTDKLVAVLTDIEKYLLEYTSTTFNAFVNIIDERINEHVLKLEQRTMELQESNSNLEEFAYVTSHDLKEPLRKISIFLDRLVTLRERATEKENEYLDKIQSSCLRMMEMIEDLLALSLIADNKDIEKTDLQQLFDQVLSTFDHRIEETGAIVVTDQLPEVAIVPAQFRQLFQNLASNALKFIHPSRQPRFEVSHRFLHPEDVKDPMMKPALEYLEITFADNGIGFESQFEEKIFAVFQRLHQKETYEGTGIGLSICRKIAKNHGGTIRAKGSPGEGATFVITIPTVLKAPRREQEAPIIIP